MLTAYVWRSAENAVAPFDFELTSPDGQRTLVDAKATSGAFDNVIHLSLGEIIEASRDVPYRIYRVFGLDENGGKLCISGEIQPLARRLKGLHETYMPVGVRVDGYSIDTTLLNWSDIEYVSKPDEEADG